MNQINQYDNVRYTGPFDKGLALAPGEVGVVLDDYGDGNYEIEFAFPDVTTWLQCALSGGVLEPVSHNADTSAPSLTAIHPAVMAFERGETRAFVYPPTGEKLSIERGEDGRLVVTTPSIGVVASLARN